MKKRTKRNLLKISLVVLIVIVGYFFMNTDMVQNTVSTISFGNETNKKEGIAKVPENYKTLASHRGTLEKIQYTNSPRVVSAGSEKKAMVYIPYKYDKQKRYNILYLLHEYGGSEKTFLGSPAAPRPFKRMLDHMIERGDIEPTIVVALTYTKPAAYYDSMDDMGNEIIEDLAPIIESKYHTYAKSTDVKGLQASRDHRAIGGFSMGGASTWRALKNNADCFRYFLPSSMPMYYDDHGYDQGMSLTSAKSILEGVQEKAKNKKIYVFAASGSDDFMNQATEEQAKDISNYPEFTFTKKINGKGNVFFHSWKGKSHSYKETFSYFYNGLKKFFGKKSS